jgi:hypothetical protein
MTEEEKKNGHDEGALLLGLVDQCLIATTNGKDVIGIPHKLEGGFIRLDPFFEFFCGIAKGAGADGTVRAMLQCEMWPLNGLLSVQGITLPQGTLVVARVGDLSTQERTMIAEQFDIARKRCEMMLIAQRTGIDVGAGLAARRGNLHRG